MSTHNIRFCGEIRKIYTWYPLLSRPMITGFSNAKIFCSIQWFCKSTTKDLIKPLLSTYATKTPFHMGDSFYSQSRIWYFMKFVLLFQGNMLYNMEKCPYAICKQQRSRWAWAFMQSDLDILRSLTYTLQSLYNTVRYNTVLDITRFKDRSQKCKDYIEKWP